MNKSEPLLRWHGSKRQLAPTIVKSFPKDYERGVYVEPFCGSASVFFVKRPSKVEVLNDLDGDLMNLLFTVKMHPEELARTMSLLPSSRGVFAAAQDCPAVCSSIVRAARFFYLNHASFGGVGEHWAPEGSIGKSEHLHGLPFRIRRWAVRLSRTYLKCAPWQEVIEKHDSPQTLFYVDPPYLDTAGYSNPFTLPDWRELRKRLERVKGNFVLSAQGTATMKLLWRGFHERPTSVISSLGPKGRVQKELLVWNY